LESLSPEFLELMVKIRDENSSEKEEITGGTQAIKNLVTAIRKGTLTEDELAIIDKVVTLCMPPEEIPDA